MPERDVIAGVITVIAWIAVLVLFTGAISAMAGLRILLLRGRRLPRLEGRLDTIEAKLQRIEERLDEALKPPVAQKLPEEVLHQIAITRANLIDSIDQKLGALETRMYSLEQSWADVEKRLSETLKGLLAGQLAPLQDRLEGLHQEIVAKHSSRRGKAAKKE